MARTFVDRLDHVAGAGIEGTVRLKHRRRLARIGQVSALDPPRDGSLWAAAAAPRSGCALDVLIDGSEALPRIAAALEGARSHVHVAGWHVTPRFGLTRDDGARRLRDVLGELAERVDVRVLLWAGAPLPVFKPTRSQVREARDELVRGTRIRCVLDARERPMHCHHEKLVIVDGEVAFAGGIDLTTLAGDRFDTPEHRVRAGLGWHDAGTCLRGPAVADVAGHFAARWGEVDGTPAPVPSPPPGPAGDVELQVLRTIPERVYDFAPRGDFGILEAYTRALRAARSVVYLENQFLWSPEIVAILRDKLAHPPSDEFRLVVLLPSRPNNGEDDTRGQLSVLADADDGAHRFLATTISSRTGQVTSPLYVHAKVGIVDDRWLTVGSANLNEHSLFNDTEVNVATTDPALARDTRLRLWAEHLETTVEAVGGPPHRVVDELWRPVAAEQLARRRSGAPPTHRLCELPGVSRRARTIRGPLKSLADDG
ncbi:phospholipase D-like domain-containing protein [Capillimicrobium parvum]|uniref:Cardiolipin synthase B n=1 Tax=Capillimicrobium parvum TaxID=2884022 RepID=A0A9E6XZZ3_9ACTN|nr:phospholipase D family protein [Capillimicrobium parvum]UGS37133.1 Cardiolipin synthase B [Capillimicrobium parvum]